MSKEHLSNAKESSGKILLELCMSKKLVFVANKSYYNKNHLKT